LLLVRPLQAPRRFAAVLVCRHGGFAQPVLISQVYIDKVVAGATGGIITGVPVTVLLSRRWKSGDKG
jgi:hypothetical protein